jgi:hypothetical protein
MLTHEPTVTEIRPALLLSDQASDLCENPFSITCKKGCKTIRLNVPSKSIHMVLAGATLRDAYLYASSHYFPLQADNLTRHYSVSPVQYMD